MSEAHDLRIVGFFLHKNWTLERSPASGMKALVARLGTGILLGLATTVATSWLFALRPVERWRGRPTDSGGCERS